MEWRDVSGFEGYYQVSDAGRVRSVARTVPRAEGVYRVQARDLTLVIGDAGRPQVSLMLDGVRSTRRVAHLVLEAFEGPRPSGQESCHRDDDNANNARSNLYWGTHSENQQDRVRNGRHRNGRESRACCPREHALRAPNLVPSSLPKRVCLACQRAHSLRGTARRDGRPLPDLQTASDRYYAEIMGADDGRDLRPLVV